MTERCPLDGMDRTGLMRPTRRGFHCFHDVVVLVMAIISGHWQTFVPITFSWPFSVSTFTARFEASSWFGPTCSTSCTFGVISEFWTWDVAGVRSCSWPLHVDHRPGGGWTCGEVVDQSGNSLEATRRNIIAEGVADRSNCTRGNDGRCP